MFSSQPQDTRRVVEFGRPDAMNPEERWTANLLTNFLAYGVGVPSLVATAFVGIVGVWYAWIYSTDIQTFFAYAVGLLAITALSSGLPIAWASTRDNDAVVARASLGLWAACVFMNVIVMLQFARHVPEPRPASAVQVAAPVRVAIRAPNLSEEEIDRLDYEISDRWYLINDYDEQLASARGSKRERLLSAEDKRRYALAKTELEQLEIRRYGAPVILKDVDTNPHGPGHLEVQNYAAAEPAPVAVTVTAPASPAQSPGLDMAIMALIMIAASAIGLLISAGSLAAVMMAKVREQRMQAVEDVVPEVMPATGPRVHLGESLDGFEPWIGGCLSYPAPNGVVRPAEAFAHYEAFCAVNGIRAPLPDRTFYQRFANYLAATYGITRDHSNGSVYRGVALFDDAHSSGPAGHGYNGQYNGHGPMANGHGSGFDNGAWGA